MNKPPLRDTNTYLENGDKVDIFAPDVDESKLAYPAGDCPKFREEKEYDILLGFVSVVIVSFLVVAICILLK